MPDYLFLEHPLWIAVFVATCVAFMFSTSWVHRRERAWAGGENRDRGSRALIYAMSALAQIIELAGPYLMPGARINLDHTSVFVVAIAFLWIGIVLYPWAAITLGRNFRTAVQLLDGQTLITRGPYRIVRHPAYAAGFAMFTGFGLAVGNWLSLLGGLAAAFVAYAWRIHVEELALADRFGAEFAAQKKKTWAVIPLLW